ncbi:universal stress protein [Streptomyces sp. ICBB 8177]|uniref:universal stress protein n=1 Tax=Streptomyces sp. ICBB 8177 TaxID=563922 RepID=UPI000D67AE38|nr:universal stress protein [Streptomyces sp. ICBB 8177]PWI44721.1 universal stress protein [Streptomyces sp. ICBB 8177]
MSDATTRYVAVGYDGSPSAGLALDWAADEAALRGCALRIGHAWEHAPDRVPGPAVPEPAPAPTPGPAMPEPDEPQVPGPAVPQPAQPPGASRQAVDSLLTEARERAAARHPGLDATTAVLTDSPVHGLLRMSADAELLVVGSRGQGRFVSLMLGSVSHAVATYAEVPVAVVRPGEAERPAETSGPVVIGVAPDEPPEPVMFAFAEAERRGVGLEAVRSWTYPQVYPGHRGVSPAEEARRDREEAEDLDKALADGRASHPDVRVTTSVGLAEPAAALVAASRRAGLVVVGARRKRGRMSMPLGIVSQRVLHHGLCPVIVVPV